MQTRGAPLQQGRPWGFKAAVLHINADLAEYSHALGFPSVASHSHPCFLCKATVANLAVLDGWDAVSLPWGPKTLADYEDACARAEQWRLVPDAATHTALRALLDFDNDKRRSTAARGLALTQDFPALELLQGDRLEPNDGLPDIGLFDEIQAFPVRVVFWRRRAETLTQHRNPLFSELTGITHERGALDWLHTPSLGVFQTWC